MSGAAVRGWCPGVQRPMATGDGLLVRVRPPAGRLSAAQAAGLAELASRFGAGGVELTSRANLQLRGVDPADHPALAQALTDFGLAPGTGAGPGTAAGAGAGTERRHGLVVSPFLAAPEGLVAVVEAVAEERTLPEKFGFALDTGAGPVLTEAAADLRVERAAAGGLLLRPDGAATGQRVTEAGLPQALRSMLGWYLAQVKGAARPPRMRALVAAGALPPACDTAAMAPRPVPAPGLHPGGALVALPFGLLPAATLAALAALAPELRITPWRALFLPGVAALPPVDGLVTDPTDPILRIDCCTGAPGCAQAHAATRDLARALAPHLPDGRSLHLSGCAKGCAHPGVADLTLCARPDGFALIRDGRAGDPPCLTGLAAEAILDHPQRLFGSP